MSCDRVIYKTPLSLKAFSTFIAQDADSVGYHVAFHRPCCTLDLSTNLTALYLESRGPRWKSHKHETKRCCESSSWLISDERESVDPEIIHSSDMWSDVCNVCGKQPDICANFWEHMELWIWGNMSMCGTKLRSLEKREVTTWSKRAPHGSNFKTLTNSFLSFRS